MAVAESSTAAMAAERYTAALEGEPCCERPSDSRPAAAAPLIPTTLAATRPDKRKHCANALRMNRKTDKQIITRFHFTCTLQRATAVGQGRALRLSRLTEALPLTSPLLRTWLHQEFWKTCRTSLSELLNSVWDHRGSRQLDLRTALPMPKRGAESSAMAQKHTN